MIFCRLVWKYWLGGWLVPLGTSTGKLDSKFPTSLKTIIARKTKGFLDKCVESPCHKEQEVFFSKKSNHNGYGWCPTFSWLCWRQTIHSISSIVLSQKIGWFETALRHHKRGILPRKKSNWSRPNYQRFIFMKKSWPSKIDSFIRFRGNIGIESVEYRSCH